MFSYTVRSMFVVIINEFRNEIIEMCLAESDEMVQGFVFNRLYNSFDPGIEIRIAEGTYSTLLSSSKIYCGTFVTFMFA